MSEQVDPTASQTDRATLARPQPGKMDLGELRMIVAREIDQALGTKGGKLSTDRRMNLEYYEGSMSDLDTPPEGRSSVTMLTVLEAVEWVLPALLRIFCASDKLADFEPASQNDEQAANQASQYLTHIFYKDNSGFMLLHDWIKDALIQKLGWVKVFWDTEEVIEVNDYKGLTQDQYQAMLAAGDVEVLEEQSYPAPKPDGIDEDAPNPQAGIEGAMLYDCTLRHVRTEGRIKLDGVPPEEVLVSRRAKRNAPIPFIAHRRERTYTDLLEEGYDADCLDALPSYDAPQYNSERVARYEQEDDFPFTTERTDKPAREIWVEECYLRVDYDQDGRAELNKIVTAGNGQVILTKNGKPDIEPIDDIPLISLCPIPMPHKLVGMGLADLVMDLQQIKTVLARQMLDNVYLAHNARTVVEDQAANENTYDDLLTSRPGGVIRVKKAEGIVPHLVPFIADKAQALIQYFDQLGEIRTGVARHNQEIDADVINKSSSGLQTHLLQQAAAQRVELIARIFAETGIKELCTKILGLVMRYQQRERVIRVTGQWVEMDPRQWRNSMQVSINVGLGTGNRDQIAIHLKEILEAQLQIVQQQKGLNGPLVYGKNVFDALERASENAGFKESFFTDPSKPPPPGQGAPQQPPPDPEMIKAQAQMALEQQKVKLASANDQARLQADLAAQRSNAEVDSQRAQQRAQLGAHLAQQKLEHEMRLEQMREEFRQAQERRELEMRAAAGAFAPAQPGAVAA